MADGRHFENSFNAISQPEIIRFQRNLVCRWGESAFTYYGSSFSQCDGYDVGISQCAGASTGPQAARARRPAPAYGPAPAGAGAGLRPALQQQYMFNRTVLTTCLPRVCFFATAVRRSHSSCKHYKEYFETLSQVNGWTTEVEKAKNLTLALEGAARDVLKDVSSTSLTPYSDTWKHLARRFGWTDSQRDARRRLKVVDSMIRRLCKNSNKR